MFSALLSRWPPFFQEDVGPLFSVQERLSQSRFPVHLEQASLPHQTAESLERAERGRADSCPNEESPHLLCGERVNPEFCKGRRKKKRQISFPIFFVPDLCLDRPRLCYKFIVIEQFGNGNHLNNNYCFPPLQ